MEHQIIAKLFGEFEMYTKDNSSSKMSASSKKIAELLAFLLVNRQQKLTREHIMNSLWNREETGNPISALKTTIHRARKNLLEIGDDEFIVSGKGGYQWNPEIPVTIDVEEFDDYCKKAEQKKLSDKERIKACEKAIEQYTGEFMNGGNGQHWMELLATYYRGEMLRLYSLLCKLYYQNKEWDKIEKICLRALQQHFIDEEIYYYLLMVKVIRGNEKEIKKLYAEAEKALKGELGLNKSKKLESVLIKESPIVEEEIVKSVEDIHWDSHEQGGKGAFYCSYAVFCEIYQLKNKMIRRGLIRNEQMDAALMMINVNINNKDNKKKVILDYEIQQGAMDLVQMAINSRVRQCDVVCRCSAYQYVLLLDNCDEEQCDQIKKRIRDIVLRKDKTIDIWIEYRQISEIEREKDVLGL